jgi:processive 1,2-diacylglycerol beta-glucosyltransferase
MNKKKIIIFTSRGGGGHLSATDALKQYLGDEYDVQSYLIFQDVLKPLDLIQVLTFGKYTGEDFYNYCMKRKWFATLNFLYKTGKNHFQFFSFIAKKLLKNFLQKHKPDLIISVIPIANGPILAVAQELSIPFLVIPTDLDVTTFIVGIDNPSYEKFLFTIPFEYAGTRKTLAKANIVDQKMRVTGFPVRTPFLQAVDNATLKIKWNFPTDKPVILIIMGAVGSAESYLLAPYLAQIPHSAHIVFCIGRNESLREKIESVTYPSHLTRSIIGFTPNIAELMQCADLIVTKSGSVTVSECLYSKLPLLLDATSTVLAWEKMNHALVQEYSIGDIIKHHNDIAPKITRLLQDRASLGAYKNNFDLLERMNTKEEVIKIVKEMIN